jgi:DNA mismatch repair protein MutL
VTPAAPAPAPRPIRPLLPATVERIAAGEVVDRPASVVKELVENSFDAGAGSVVVRLEGGGLARLEVADDGSGIPAAELGAAVERHATSKLDPDGPIEGIGSLGFRGEALAAIAAVSRLRVLSRPPGQDVGEGLLVVGGVVTGRVTDARAPGTTVDVEGLFFNTPARRKFLRAPAAEQLEVLRTVERLYLARPGTAMRVEAEGHEVGTYPPTASLRDAAARVVGPEFLDASFRVEADVPGGRAIGILSLPRLSASSGGSLYLAVNGRTVASRPLAAAVRAAFGDALPRARFPIGVLHLELALDRVDVNVHPTKREVRFERERELAEALRRAVRAALLSAAEIGGPSPGRPTGIRPLGAPGAPPREVAGAAAPVAAAPSARRTPPLLPPAPAPPLSARPGRPSLELLGSLHNLYWLAAAPGGLVLIDQHAASERLLYESVRRSGSLARQELVDPVPLELSGAQRASLAAHADAVRASGFEVEPFGPAVVRVLSVPSYRGRLARAEAVRELLDELATGGRTTVPDGLEERTAASIACHAAIRAGDVVEREEIARLVAALDALPEASRTCPHGRPIMVELDRGRLDRWFLRSTA